MESHHKCDGKQSSCTPSRRRLKRMVLNQNRGAEKSKIAAKIRNRLDILKRDRVKIVLL
jgi:hypothetical protein